MPSCHHTGRDPTSSESGERSLGANAVGGFVHKIESSVERKVSEEENRRLVEETVQRCRTMDPREAIQHVRQALQQVPGDERLLGLQSLSEDRLRNIKQEEAREWHLVQAREALYQKRYADAVRILER